VRAYELGVYAFLSAAVFACVRFAEGTQIGEHLLHQSPEAFALRVVEIICCISVSVSAISIPRRPHVFHQGETVDRMFTASALSRFTWSWATPLLNPIALPAPLPCRQTGRQSLMEAIPSGLV
jgi:hypothetical protein